MMRRMMSRHVAIVLVAAAAATTFIVLSYRAPAVRPTTVPPFVLKKGDPDAREPGENKRALIGAMDERWPDYTPEVEAYLLRAYPEAEVPGEATIAASNGWNAMKAGPHSDGAWELIGPSKATYPAVLNPFLFDGAPYVASGRVTAMALAPRCTPEQMPALRRGGRRRRLANR